MFSWEETLKKNSAEGQTSLVVNSCRQGVWGWGAETSRCFPGRKRFKNSMKVRPPWWSTPADKVCGGGGRLETLPAS